MTNSDTVASRHIVFLDRETLPEQVTVRPPAFAHTMDAYQRTKPEDVVARARDAEIIITNKVPLRADTLAELPKLQMIAVSATGTDIIDLKTCRERGIVVSNIREYAIATVPEHTMGLILALSRSIQPYHNSVAAGRWKEADQFCYFDYPIFDLKGKVLGIIGDGVLGKAVAKLGEAFGMDVELHSSGPAHRHCMAAIRNSNYYELALVHPALANPLPPIFACGYSDALEAVAADGTFSVPTGPGLGVTLDTDFLAAAEIGRRSYGRP